MKQEYIYLRFKKNELLSTQRGCNFISYYLAIIGRVLEMKLFCALSKENYNSIICHCLVTEGIGDTIYMRPSI